MTNPTNANVKSLVMSAVIVALAGCASTPKESPILSQARNAVNQAEQDPNVSKYAPSELQRARASLSDAEATAKKNGVTDADALHDAYSATLLARIKSGETERQQILLSARENEANRALMQARDAQAAAEQARNEAQNAQTEAQRAQAQLLKEQEESRRLAGELQAAQTQRGLVLTLGDVLFDTGRSELKPGAERTIDKLTSFLNENPERKVQIEGFTDSQGTDEYNQQLSQRRADAVASAIMARGVQADRVRARGYGEEFPVASNDNAGSRQRNRRVEVVISNGNQPVPERSAQGQ
jgi:outer membrane protein OmpA-like peptidoglycan-associated protein